MKNKIDTELRKDLEKLLHQMENPSQIIKTDEGKKYELVLTIIHRSFELGNFKFANVITLAEEELASEVVNYLNLFKVVYLGMYSSEKISDEIFNNMDEVETVRSFKMG